VFNSITRSKTLTASGERDDRRLLSTYPANLNSRSVYNVSGVTFIKTY